MVFNRNCFSKMRDFSRLGALQTVTYTIKLLISKKWREIDTLLLHTTNRNYHMAYLFVPFPMTVDDLAIRNAIRRTFVRHLARF